MEESSHLEKGVVLQPFKFEPFKYTDLPPRSIRLLSFVERHAQPQSYRIGNTPLIECWLETSDLHTSPTYEVLSYAAGNPLNIQPDQNDEYGDTSKWPIAVNGRLLYISRNLYEGLSRLRELRRDSRAVAQQEKRHEYEKTQLIRAAEQGNLDNVIECLRSGADIHAKDAFGETALHYAAENGLLDVVKTLLEHGASVDEIDGNHRTPFACCVQQRRGEHEEVASLLLEWKGEWHGEAATKIGEPFWIEAVCIDQSNIEERNVQAAMMTQVLSQARMVIAWIGVDDATTPIACQALMESDSTRESITHYLQHKWNGDADQGMDIDSESDTSPLSARQIQAVMALLDRSWFRRTSVAQEIAMAKHLAIHCGPYNFNWSEISVLLQILKSNGSPPRRHNFPPLTPTAESGPLTLRVKRAHTWTDSGELDPPRPFKRISA